MLGKMNLHCEQIWTGWMEDWMDGWLVEQKVWIKKWINVDQRRTDLLLLFGQNTQDSFCPFLYENIQLIADYENHHIKMMHKALLAIYKALG